MESNTSNIYNFGDISIDRGNFVAGDVVNSVLNVNSHITQIEKEIEEKADDDDRENLKEILEEYSKIKGFEIIEMEVMPDYVHLLLSY